MCSGVSKGQNDIRNDSFFSKSAQTPILAIWIDNVQSINSSLTDVNICVQALSVLSALYARLLEGESIISAKDIVVKSIKEWEKDVLKYILVHFPFLQINDKVIFIYSNFINLCSCILNIYPNFQFAYLI